MSPPKKEPTIEDHIKRAKELTIPQVSVREEAFTELVRAVEKMNEKYKFFWAEIERIEMIAKETSQPLIPPDLGIAVQDEEE